MGFDIDVSLESPNGPRVVVTGEANYEAVALRLPEGWRIHEDDWSNGVKLGPDRWSYALSRAPLSRDEQLAARGDYERDMRKDRDA